MNNSKIKAIAVFAVIILLAVGGFIGYQTLFVKRGWVKTDAGTYYYDNGKAYSGMKKMSDGTIRYFDPETNIMVTGEKEIDGNRYLFDAEGVMLTGLQEYNGSTRFYNPETGTLMTGWFEVSDNGDASQLPGGIKPGKYYAAPDTGNVALGLSVIGGKQYYFDKETGIMQTGWMEMDGDKYYFNEGSGEGADGIIEINGDRYGFIGGKVVRNQRAIADKHLYYFDDEGKIWREIDGNKPMVALTYDDGPSIYTNQILDAFVQYNQRCTFFIVGDRISWNEDPARREIELGFEQGNHTYSHDRLTKFDAEGQKEVLKGTDDELVRIGGKPTTCLRPPEGKWNDTLKESCGLPIILWSIDSRDWESRNKDKIIGQIVGKVKDGDIVLMHDLYQATADATQQIVPSLVEAGFQLVTVEEMGIIKRGGLDNGVVYYSIENK